MIVQIPYHEYDHSYALEARRRYPHRFAIVGPLASLAGETLFALDHAGGVGFDSRAGDDFERLLRLSKHENVYVKTSHLYGLDRSPQEEAAIPAALERLRDGYGADRLMFGSNWPLVRSFAGLERSVDGFKNAIASFPRSDVEAILCRTAEKLYRWSR